MSPGRREQFVVVVVLGAASVANMSVWVGLGYVIWRLL